MSVSDTMLYLLITSFPFSRSEAYSVFAEFATIADLKIFPGKEPVCTKLLISIKEKLNLMRRILSIRTFRICIKRIIESYLSKFKIWK